MPCSVRHYAFSEVVNVDDSGFNNTTEVGDSDAKRHSIPWASNKAIKRRFSA
jgi:hypothetical protein